MSMSNRRGLSRGDKRRNARLARLREVLPRENAILAIDLADDKQVLVLVDHDSRVLARRALRVRAWQLGEALAWGAAEARAAGFASVTVACEPTGHRWRVVGDLCVAAGLVLVCAQPLLVHRAREAEDYTRDKSDAKDALLIARLAAELRVYLPERQDPVWARLRHLGARRADLTTRAGAARQRLRDLLECAWPQALDAAADPLDSTTWLASVAVALRLAGRDGAAELARVRRAGWARFAAAVAGELPAWGGKRRCHRIMRAVYDAAADRRGVLAHRPGALERAGFALAERRYLAGELAEVETRMLGVLDELGLTGLLTSIPGVSAVGAAAILAEAGDPARFDGARALVKHAGICPRANESGTYTGKTSISRRGRPRLRLAAWRAAWAAIRHNPVLAARYAHLTGREHNRLTDPQARVAVAGALLRQLFVVVTRRVPWDPAIAGGARDPRKTEVNAAA
jgi:transposase